MSVYVCLRLLIGPYAWVTHGLLGSDFGPHSDPNRPWVTHA
jgi:hypothetical protein